MHLHATCPRNFENKKNALTIPFERVGSLYNHRMAGNLHECASCKKIMSIR